MNELPRTGLLQRAAVSLVIPWLFPCLAPVEAGAVPTFRRGDVNLDGRVNAADAAFLMNALFLQGQKPACDDAADADDDGSLKVADVGYLLGWLFPEGATPPPAPPPPFKAPGKDPTTGDSLGCLVDTVTPPGDPDPALEMQFEGPPAVKRGQKGVELYLRAALSGPIDGFSIAYLLDKQSVLLRGVDLAGTAVFGKSEQDRRLKFEASDFFRVAVVSTQDDPQHDLLLVGVVLVEMVAGKYQRIEIPAPLAPISNPLLLRVLVDVKATAALGAVDILKPLPLGTTLTEVTNDLFRAGRSGLPGSTRSGTSRIRDAGEIFFLRADANGDGGVDITDAIFGLNSLFLGGPPTSCDDAADANDDGSVDIADPVFTLLFLFASGTMPSLYPWCGPDVTDETPRLTCTAGCS